MRLTLFISFLLLGLSLNAQSLEKLKNGVSIKGIEYSDKEYNVEFKTFILDKVSIKMAQIFRKDTNTGQFICRAIIQTSMNGKMLNELYFDNIEPVGSAYGLCFNDKQPDKNYIIGSKYGDYSGQLIIIDKKGDIMKHPGGNYFISDDKYIVSNWYSDRSGLTIFDLETSKIVFSKELPVYLSKWHKNAGKFYAAEHLDNKETNNIYEFNMANFTLLKTGLDLDQLQQFKEVDDIGCKPN